jgi:hypothetical protein
MTSQLLATSSSSAALAYIVIGLLIAGFGLVLASNFRDITPKYLRKLLRTDEPFSEKQLQTLRNFRVFYGVMAVLGIFVLISGLLRL